MRKLLPVIVIAALAAATSHAQSDVAEQAAAEKPASEAAAPAVTPATTTADKADAATDEAREFKPPPGWKARKVKGVTMYCRKTMNTGSRFDKEDCMDEARLKAYEAANQDARNRMQQSLSLCSNPAVCVNN